MNKFILPSIGDPLMLNYWFINYDTVWGKEVDGGTISLLSPIEDEVVEWIRKQCEIRNITFIYQKRNWHSVHGENLEVSLSGVDYNDNVIILEDDTLFNTSGIVSNWFELLKSGKSCVGGFRTIGGPEMQEVIRKLYNIVGDSCLQAPFLVIKASILKDILADHPNCTFFAGEALTAGKPIKYLNNYVPTKDQGADTFDCAAMEILSRIDTTKIHRTISYRGSGEDPTVDLKLPYVNIGSMSMGIVPGCGMIKDGEGRALIGRKVLPPCPSTPILQGHNQRWPRERMLSWFMAFHMSWKHQELKEFTDLYLSGIKSYIDLHNLDGTKIEKYALQLKR